MKQSIEESELYVLVRTAPNRGRYVQMVAEIGQLVFGASVHRSVYRWAAECVERLGLENDEIAVLRGLYQHHKGAPNSPAPNKGSTWGVAILRSKAGCMAVFYSARLRRKDQMLISNKLTGLTKSLNIIDVTILHELLHLRWPDMEEKRVEQLAYDVFFRGWEALQDDGPGAEAVNRSADKVVSNS
jgi:hypothetical protein